MFDTNLETSVCYLSIFQETQKLLKNISLLFFKLQTSSFQISLFKSIKRINIQDLKYIQKIDKENNKMDNLLKVIHYFNQKVYASVLLKN